MKRELCWLITKKCSADCKFCHFFEKEYTDLPLEDNREILYNLHSVGVNDIVWSGGEALLYEGIESLLKESNKLGIHNTLITNGFFPPNVSSSIFKYLNVLVLSLDTLTDEVNEMTGRGKNSRVNVLNTMHLAKSINPMISIRINTVLSKVSIPDLEILAKFVEDQEVATWRLHKFVPIRGNAKINQEQFCISKSEYLESVEVCRSICRNTVIEMRQDDNYNSLYILIDPTGNIIKTVNYNDFIMGTSKNKNDLEKIWKKK